MGERTPECFPFPGDRQRTVLVAISEPEDVKKRVLKGAEKRRSPTIMARGGSALLPPRVWTGEACPDRLGRLRLPSRGAPAIQLFRALLPLF